MKNRLSLVWYILPIILLTGPRYSMSQSRINEDSLLHVIANTDSPEVLIKSHNGLSRYYMRNDTNNAIYHLGQLDSISASIKDTVSMILTGDIWMRYYAMRSNYNIAEYRAKENLRLSLLLQKPKYVSNAYNNLGIINWYKSELDSALYYIDTSYRISLQLPQRDPLKLTKSLNNLGGLAIEASNYNKALVYYIESLTMAEESDDPLAISRAYGGIGITYKKLEDIEASRNYYKKALTFATSAKDYMQMGDLLNNIGGTYKITNADSAIFYYQEALQLYEKINRKKSIGNCALSLGDVYNNIEDHSKALEYFKRAYELFQGSGNRKKLIDTKSRLAKTYYELGDIKKAQSYIGDVVQFYNDQNDLTSRSKAYSLKSKILEATGDNRNAMIALRQHYLLKDSLDSRKFNKEVREIQTKFETQQKEIEIAQQQSIITKQESEKKILTFGSILGALLLTSIIIGLYHRYKKNKELNAQQTLIQSQKIDQLEKEKKILGMNAMIEGQEAERSRIAKDLHDGLGGLLSTVKAHFSNIQSEIQKIEKISVYNRAHEMMDEACDEVRRISHNLMPGALRLEGLGEAVRHLAAETSEAHPIQVDVEIIGFESRMEESKEVFVYRIIQEALNNIIKHADASHVLIQLSETETEYHFIIEDDGCGFEFHNVASGLGIKSIQSRVDFLKGNLDIDSKKGVGTTITWQIPK